MGYAEGILTLTLRFSGEVSGSLTKEDLQLLLNSTPVDPEKVSFSHDPATRRATWKLPAASTDSLHAELPSAFVTDPQGRPLDGDGNGSPGGTFLLEQPVPLDLPVDASPPRPDR